MVQKFKNSRTEEAIEVLLFDGKNHDEIATFIGPEHELWRSHGSDSSLLVYVKGATRADDAIGRLFSDASTRFFVVRRADKRIECLNGHQLFQQYERTHEQLFELAQQLLEDAQGLSDLFRSGPIYRELTPGQRQVLEDVEERLKGVWL